MYYNKYRLLFTGAGSYDADAQTYFTAAGITDAGHKSAWNTFVLDCKANGNWTPLIAAYPVIGGTSGTHAINAKTPGTYNLTFTGITHSSSGITGNGTTNNVDTGIQPSTAFSSNINVHYCFYTSTSTVTSTAISDMGAFNSTNNIVPLGNSTSLSGTPSNPGLTNFNAIPPLAFTFTTNARSTTFSLISITSIFTGFQDWFPRAKKLLRAYIYVLHA